MFRSERCNSFQRNPRQQEFTPAAASMDLVDFDLFSRSVGNRLLLTKVGYLFETSIRYVSKRETEQTQLSFLTHISSQSSRRVYEHCSGRASGGEGHVDRPVSSIVSWVIYEIRLTS